MRQNNKNNRSRGRGRKNPNPLSRSYESNGPDVKVRGSAQHVAEKYLSLARDALSSGDGVAAENYFQHAEHYNRIIMSAQAQQNQNREEERRQHAAEHAEQPSIDPTPQENNATSTEDVPTANGAVATDVGEGENQEAANDDAVASSDEPQPRVRRRRPPARSRRNNDENGSSPSPSKEDNAGSNVEAQDSLAANPPAFLTAD